MEVSPSTSTLDPQVQEALRAQEAYERSMAGLFWRLMVGLFWSYSKSEISCMGFSLNTPLTASPSQASIPPSAPDTAAPTPQDTAPNTRNSSPDVTPLHTHTSGRRRSSTGTPSRSHHSSDYSGQRRSSTGLGSRALSGRRTLADMGEGGGCFSCFGSARISKD